MNDFAENMLDVVAETELFDSGDCVKVDHDPITDQLKGLRTVPFEEARAGRNNGHYEVLLHVRVRRERRARDEIDAEARRHGVMPGAEPADLP